MRAFTPKLLTLIAFVLLGLMLAACTLPASPTSVPLTLTGTASPVPTSTETPTLTPTQTASPTPSATPLPPTPDYVAELIYHPEDRTLCNPQSTPVFVLAETGTWVRLVPEAVQARQESDQWQVGQTDDRRWIAKPTEPGQYWEVWNDETDQWEVLVSLESLAWRERINLENSIVIEVRGGDGQVMGRTVIAEQVIEGTGLAGLNFENFDPEFLPKVYEETLGHYRIISGGDLKINGIERMIVTQEMFEEITAELADPEVAQLCSQYLEDDLLFAVVKDGLMTGRYYHDKPPVEIEVETQDLIGFFMSRDTGVLVFYDEDAGQLISVMTSDYPGSPHPFVSGCIFFRSLSHFDWEYIDKFPERALKDIFYRLFHEPIFVESHVVAGKTERDLQLKGDVSAYIDQRLGGSTDNWREIWAENGEKIIETE